MKRLELFAGYLIVLAVALSSCSSTNYLTLSVQEPSPVYVPRSLKTVGIVDATLPEDKNQKADNLEKIFSLEEKNLDKDGAKAAVDALYNELGKTNRFTEIKLIHDPSLKSPGMGVFPATLSWETVQKICYENQVDVLFVLSFYDTDSRIEYTAIPVEVTGPLGVKIPAVEQQATVYTLIKTGWRIYDPVNKVLCDEFIDNEEVILSGRGINPMKAAEAIVGRKQAVLQRSTSIGQNYAYRILPYSIRVRREYFVRGTDNFKIAKRRAQTGNWDGAAELWMKETSNPKGKIAGRAAYNMAISNEINGELKAAVDWAAKAYTDYRNKKALPYLNILKNRISKNAQIEQESQ